MLETLEKTHEIVGLFKDHKQLQEAVRDLEATAFPRDAITVLGSRKNIEEKFGHATLKLDEAVENNDTPREAPIRPEEQTIGTSALVGCAAYVGVVSTALALGTAALPVTLMAVILGGVGSAAIAGFLAERVHHKFDEHIHDQLEQGGLILWVRAQDSARKLEAYDILQNHGAVEIKVK